MWKIIALAIVIAILVWTIARIIIIAVNRHKNKPQNKD